MKDFFFLNRYRSQLTVDLISKGFWKWSKKKLPIDCLKKNLEHVSQRSQKTFKIDWISEKIQKSKTEKMRNWGSTQSLFCSLGFAERDSLFETALKRRTILWLFSTSLSFYLLRSKNSVDSLLHWTKKRPKKQLSSLQSNCRVWKLENGQSFDRLYGQK